MKKIIIIALSILLVSTLFGCKAVDTTTSDGKITIVVGIVPEATFVEKVAGDMVSVITLIPPGNSPANYQPTTTEMQALSDATIYFSMQTPTEEANILPKAMDFNNDIQIVKLRDEVKEVYPLRMISGHNHEEEGEEEHEEEGEEIVDPHIWLSPKRVIVMVQIIADKLSQIDKENEQTYQANAAEYISELEELDAQIAQGVQNIENKNFLIYHGAYGYFADDYGLQMISLESEGKKVTAAKMQEVIDYANQEGITTVYYQEEFDDNQAKTVADEVGGNVSKTAPLSPDYIQSLKSFVAALSGLGE